jgi:hypothetical protein
MRQLGINFDPQARTPFRSIPPEERATTKFYHVYLDLYGPIIPISLDEGKYALALTDEYADMAWGYIIRGKLSSEGGESQIYQNLINHTDFDIKCKLRFYRIHKNPKRLWKKRI